MESSENLLSSRLLSLLKNGEWGKDDVVKLFDALVKEFKDCNGDFHTWMIKNLHQVEIHKIRALDLSLNDRKTVGHVEAKIIEKSKNINEKTLNEIVEEICEQADIDKEMMKRVTDIVSSVNDCLSASTAPHLRGIKQTLFNLCKAVEKTMNYKPRVTQMVSWCILALSESSRLVQVLTGEGKSCIVAMFAAYQVKMGKTPDIISSSPVLAERDVEEWFNFYNEMDITVDVNTNKSKDDELRKCYGCQVVYGTTDHFAGDFLRQRFHRRNVRPNRAFQCVIVDEVDSLMLDKGLEVVYLNSNMPLMEPLNKLLAEIWFVINHLKHLETGETLGPIQLFSQVLSEIITENKNMDLVQMTVGEAKQLDNASVDQTEAFLNMFVRKFSEYSFKLYQEGPDGNLQKVNEISPTGTDMKQEISVLLLENGKCRLVYYEKNILVKSLGKMMCKKPDSKKQNEPCIPGLQDLINGKIHTWIENALLAKTMTLGHEYIFHGDGVVPVDYKCTGVVQNNMRWGEGLQQFLEMKHQTKLSNMTLITNFMSNVGLFKKYSKIYGITGTLGDQTELNMVKELYNGIDTFKIPSFRRRKLYELEGLVIPEEDEWIRTVCNVVRDQVSSTDYRGPRAALVICETIKRADMFRTNFAGTISQDKLKLYVNNNMDNSTVTGSTVQAGDVIIATNLAGRGTDLKVCESVNEAGGLFVVQTFLPLNVRVEQQAFGRTARQGSPGSAQIIMCASHFSDSTKLVMAEISLTSSLSRLNSLTTKLIKLMKSILMPHGSTEGLFEETVNNYLKNNCFQTHEAMVSALKSLLTVKSIRFTENNLEKAKAARNILVKARLSRFLKKDIPKILKEEKLFSVYLDVLDGVYEDAVFSDQLDVIVSSLHECWGLWRLMNLSEEKHIDLLKEQLKVDLSSAKQKLLRKQSPSSMVYYYIRSGNNLREKGRFTESIKMFTKALEDGASGEIIPLYNRALATIMKKDAGYITRALTDLEKADKAIDSYKLHLATILTNVKLSSQEANVDGKNLLTKQFRVKCMIVDLLQMNIQDSVIKLRRVESRRGNVRLTEKHTVFLAEGLMKCAVSTQTDLAEILAIFLIDDFVTRAEISRDDMSLPEKFAKFWAEHFMKGTENRGDANQTERLSSRRASSFLPDGSLLEDLILSPVRVLIELLMEFEHIMSLGLDTIFSLEIMSESTFSALFSKMFKQS
ncbi:protein translocase subunit SecA-like [Puntigrus tetrazona]|uniref:protein translocase subunit SecA-like n=1 Tax=Puntigrus tetrazona TaxID=1606681 RepID=UPI001C8AD883|nr:protein translocase subunit SecA-like [Puntigrus tetrazona]